MYYNKKFFDKFDVTSNQFNILRILRGQYPKPANIILLKERMLDKMSDASRLVERLLKKGLVKEKFAIKTEGKLIIIITKKD